MQAFPPLPPPRVELYSRRLGGMRVFAIVLVVLMMIILAPVLSLLVGILVAFASHTAGYIAGIAVFLLVECAFLVLLLSLVRAAAWLDGSVLVVRTALATRRRDLARAPDVTLRWRSETVPVYGPNGPVGSVPTGRKNPVLCVRDRVGGKPLRLQLVDPGTRQPLAGPALAALAGAIGSGGQWPGRDNASIQRVLAELHALAAESPARR